MFVNTNSSSKCNSNKTVRCVEDPPLKLQLIIRLREEADGGDCEGGGGLWVRALDRLLLLLIYWERHTNTPTNTLKDGNFEKMPCWCQGSGVRGRKRRTGWRRQKVNENSLATILGKQVVAELQQQQLFIICPL